MEREIESKYFIFGHLTGYVIFGELITPLSYQCKTENYRETKKKRRKFVSETHEERKRKISFSDKKVNSRSFF